MADPDDSDDPVDSDDSVAQGTPRARTTDGGRRASALGSDRARGRSVRGAVASARWRIGGAAAVVLVLAVLGIAAAGAAIRSAGDAGASSIPLTDGTSAPESPAGAAGQNDVEDTGSGGSEIYVHVLGAVLSPGLYTLASDARVVDAIAAAGGFGENADPATVNLARTVTDGEQIVVGEPGQPPAAGDGSGGTPGVAGTDGAGAAPGGGPLSLNTATAEQLESLPRIGPALAERIIAWRTENGPFRLVDELLDVPGIGDAILAGLDGLVTT